jgi:hypothetical protein
MKTVSVQESRKHEVVNTTNSSDEGNDKQEFKEMIDQLKKKFHKSDSISEKSKNFNCSSAKLECVENCKRISDIKLDDKES